MALALPPWHFLPALLAFAVLDRKGIGIAGVWLFAFGHHLMGLNWIANAFAHEAERFGALAIPGVVALSVILATIAAFSIAVLFKLVGRDGWRRAAALIFGWTLAELLRGPWGTQFPWNPTSLIWSVHDWTMQPIAWLGSEAFGALTLLIAILAGRALGQRRAWLALSAIAIIAGIAFSGYWRLPPLASPDDEQPMLHLVQPNIAQHHKWDPDRRREWFLRHVEMSASAGEPASLLIWPESSVPYSLEVVADAAALIAQNLPPGGIALVGSDLVDRSVEPILLQNSVYAIDHQAQIAGRYAKVQLVPFGEYLPFRQILAPLGLEALAIGSVDFRPGDGRHALQLQGLPAVGPLVCYEAAFAGMATAPGSRPQWLLNITNDGWFGISAGPYQHLNMARMRAVETGLPLVRAANTGISVVTDAYGRVLTSLPLGVDGQIRHRLPQALPQAPPAGWHHWYGWGLFLALFAAAVPLAAWRDRRARPNRA